MSFSSIKKTKAGAAHQTTKAAKGVKLTPKLEAKSTNLILVTLVRYRRKMRNFPTEGVGILCLVFPKVWN
jgi:hypothetical protein